MKSQLGMSFTPLPENWEQLSSKEISKSLKGAIENLDFIEEMLIGKLQREIPPKILGNQGIMSKIYMASELSENPIRFSDVLNYCRGCMVKHLFTLMDQYQLANEDIKFTFRDVINEFMASYRKIIWLQLSLKGQDILTLMYNDYPLNEFDFNTIAGMLNLRSNELDDQEGEKDLSRKIILLELFRICTIITEAYRSIFNKIVNENVEYPN